MAFYGYTRQNQDYGFIKDTGKAVGEAFTAVDKARKLKLSNEEYDENVYKPLVLQAAKLASDAGLSEPQAVAMAMKYIPRNKGVTTVEDNIKLDVTNEARFKAALVPIKRKKVNEFSKSTAGTPEVPAVPKTDVAGAPMQISPTRQPEQQRATDPGNVGRDRLAATELEMAQAKDPARDPSIGGHAAPAVLSTPVPTYSERSAVSPLAASREPEVSVASPREIPTQVPGLSQEPAQDAVAATPASLQKLRSLVRDLGLSSDEEAGGLISEREAEVMAAKIWPDGTTSNEVYQYALAQGIDSDTAEKYAKNFPTIKDVMAYENKREANRLRDDANKIRSEANSIRATLGRVNAAQRGKKLEGQSAALVLSKIRAAQAAKDRVKLAATAQRAKLAALTKVAGTPTAATRLEIADILEELSNTNEAELIYDQVIKGYGDLLEGNVDPYLGAGSGKKTDDAPGGNTANDPLNLFN